MKKKIQTKHDSLRNKFNNREIVEIDNQLFDDESKYIYTYSYLNDKLNILPDWALSEKAIIDFYEKNSFSHNISVFCWCCICNNQKLMSLFGKITDTRPFLVFIKVNLKKLEPIGHIGVLQKWAETDGFEFIESYNVWRGAPTLIELEPFPIETIEYYKLDVKKILKECYAGKKAMMIL